MGSPSIIIDRSESRGGDQKDGGLGGAASGIIVIAVVWQSRIIPNSLDQFIVAFPVIVTAAYSV